MNVEAREPEAREPDERHGEIMRLRAVERCARGLLLGEDVNANRNRLKKLLPLTPQERERLAR